MSKFSLNTLAAKLSEKSGLSSTEAELFIRNMFDVCLQGLEADKQVKVRWLGTFKVTSVKDRESVDVNTGERIVIEGRDKISFTPDNILKEIVNKPFAQFETVVVNDGVEFDAIDKKFEAEEEIQLPEEQPSAELAKEEPEEPLTEEPMAVQINEEPEVAEQEMYEPQQEKQEPQQRPHVAQQEPQGVIDFLDTPSSESPSSDVIVIGEEDEVSTENVQPESDAKPELEPKPVPVPESELVPEPEPEPKPIAVAQQTEKEEEKEQEEEEQDEQEDEIRRHHFILPKYAVVSACIIVLALVGGIGWFAFTYGQMAAQRDHLALQLEQYKTTQAAAKVKTQEQILKEKAREDSLRMLQASEALANAEKAGKDSVANNNKAAQNIATDKATADQEKKAAEEKLAREELAKKKQQADKLAKEQQAKAQLTKSKDKQADKNDKLADAKASKYDSDPRVRTGAYSIVGVAQTITVTDGQTLAAISKKYLGPGMECYIEALNGTAQVKSGQKIKIPKLELKKKRK